MIGDFDVRRLPDLDHRQDVLPLQRQRKQPGAAAVQPVRVEGQIDLGSHEKRDAAARRRVQFQVLDRPVVQTRHVQQKDRVVALQHLRRRVAEEIGRFDLRLNPRVRPPAGPERRRQEVGVTLFGRSVDDQDRFVGGEIDHAPAAIVGGDRVLGQCRLDHVPARLGEERLHAPRHALPRLDLLDQDRRQFVDLADDLRWVFQLLGFGVVERCLDIQLDVPSQTEPEVLDRHVDKQRHAGRLRLLSRLDVGDGQILPDRLHATDQLDAGRRLLKLAQLLADLRRTFPRIGAEIGDDVDDAVLVARILDQPSEGRQRRVRADGQLGDLERVAFLFQRHVEVRGNDFGVEVGDLRDVAVLAACAVQPGRARKADQGELLQAVLAGGLAADPLDRAQRGFERAGPARAVGHRKTVVQQHVVVRRLAPEQIQPFAARHPLGQHRHQQRHGRHPHQQQQQLLQPDPLAVLLVRLQQKVHGRPPHAAVAHHVDQMDQQGYQDEQEPPRECLMNELHNN